MDTEKFQNVHFTWADFDRSVEYEDMGEGVEGAELLEEGSGSASGSEQGG